MEKIVTERQENWQVLTTKLRSDYQCSEHFEQRLWDYYEGRPDLEIPERPTTWIKVAARMSQSEQILKQLGWSIRYNFVNKHVQLNIKTDEVSTSQINLELTPEGADGLYQALCNKLDDLDFRGIQRFFVLWGEDFRCNCLQTDEILIEEHRYLAIRDLEMHGYTVKRYEDMKFVVVPPSDLATHALNPKPVFDYTVTGLIKLWCWVAALEDTPLVMAYQSTVNYIFNKLALFSSSIGCAAETEHGEYAIMLNLNGKDDEFFYSPNIEGLEQFISDILTFEQLGDLWKKIIDSFDRDMQDLGWSYCYESTAHNTTYTPILSIRYRENRLATFDTRSEDKLHDFVAFLIEGLIPIFVTD